MISEDKVEAGDARHVPKERMLDAKSSNGRSMLQPSRNDASLGRQVLMFYIYNEHDEPSFMFVPRANNGELGLRDNQDDGTIHLRKQ